MPSYVAPISLCLELPPLDTAIELPMFGFDLSGIDLLDQLQPMLAPLVPFFKIIDTIVALFNCAKAVPEAISSLSPSPLTKCIPELEKKLAALLAMNPQLIIPRMIKQICQVIIRALKRSRNQIVCLIAQVERIAAAVDRASNLNDTGLLALIACARGNAEQDAANICNMLASLGRLIGLINMLLGMVGLPELPKLDSLVGSPLALLLEPFDLLIGLLEKVRDAIPVP